MELKNIVVAGSILAASCAGFGISVVNSIYYEREMQKYERVLIDEGIISRDEKKFLKHPPYDEKIKNAVERMEYNKKKIVMPLLLSGSLFIPIFASSLFLIGSIADYLEVKKKLNNPSITPGSPLSSSGLETKVETPAEQAKPLEIIDTWKVEIKELEAIAYGGRK